MSILVWWGGGLVSFTLLQSMVQAGHTVLQVRRDLTSGYADELLFHPVMSGTLTLPEPLFAKLSVMMPSLAETRIPSVNFPLLRITGRDRVILALLDRIEESPNVAYTHDMK